MPPTLTLIDGHALAYRTYFALAAAGNRFSTSKGEPTAGIYGFASILIRILEQEKPEYLAVAFDTGKTFRNDLFPAYKATRAKMPDDLRPQIERIRQMIDAFDLLRVEKEGMEGDDVIGTIAKQAVENGMGVRIITGDRDMLQLVSDRVIVNLAGNKLSEAIDYRREDVKNALGVYPEQVVDYKAMVGDHSDNIPGVPGIGEKTAVGLLEQYPMLDEIYAHLNALPTSVRNKLEKGKDSAYLSRDLATIRTNVGVVLDLKKASTGSIDYDGVVNLFKDLEFRSLIPRLEKLKNPNMDKQQLGLFAAEVKTLGSEDPARFETVIVDSLEHLEELKIQVTKSKELALDTETTSIRAMQAELVGISLAVDEKKGYYIPVGHLTGERQLPVKQVAEVLNPFFKDPEIKKIGHHLKFDLISLLRHGFSLEGLSFDTLIAAWILDPESRDLGLKDLSEHQLHIPMTHIEELIGKGKNQLTMANVPIAKAAPYAAADAVITYLLYRHLEPKLKDPKTTFIFDEIEMPLIPVLAKMEMTGISLDVEFLKKMSTEIAKRMISLEDEAYKEAGQKFNLNSTQQLSKILFEKLKLEPPGVGKRTASGHFSTAVGVLEELKGQHKVVDLLLEYRELSKLKSTYLDSLPETINPQTHRVHTSYSQTGAVTGRLASSDPNLQNIPIRTELGAQIRQAFIAAPGNYLLSVDYSQIELRIVAHMSGDEAMLSAFRAGKDIHAATAAAIYDVPFEQVSKEQRRHSKAINFGLIYGMSPFGLSRTTDLTLAEAENFVKDYFIEFPGVKNYLDNLRKTAAKQGYVETLLGRRRYFPNLKNGGNPQLRAREEREATNSPIQGTAADILKMAMIKLGPALEKAGLNAKLLLQVHDELVLEVPEKELIKTAEIVQKIMEKTYTLSIPLTTEARWGKNWGQLKSISEYKQG
jgi:DNA polymerase-1